MLASLGVATIVCILIGIAIVVALGHTDGTIARVLYDTEHPEKRR